MSLILQHGQALKRQHVPYHVVAGINGLVIYKLVNPPDPMNHFICKGWPSKLVQLWYKSFPPGRFLPGGNEEANCVE